MEFLQQATDKIKELKAILHDDDNECSENMCDSCPLKEVIVDAEETPCEMILNILKGV